MSRRPHLLRPRREPGRLRSRWTNGPGGVYGAALSPGLARLPACWASAIPDTVLGTNCWVLATGPGTECVVVDPGFDVLDGLREELAAHRLRPAAVVLTHGHADHVWSVTPSAARAPAAPAASPRCCTATTATA